MKHIYVQGMYTLIKAVWAAAARVASLMLPLLPLPDVRHRLGRRHSDM
jgi:hypothetical protein